MLPHLRYPSPFLLEELYHIGADQKCVNSDFWNACKQKVKQKLSEICRCREGEKQQHKKAAASASA